MRPVCRDPSCEGLGSGGFDAGRPRGGIGFGPVAAAVSRLGLRVVQAVGPRGACWVVLPVSLAGLAVVGVAVSHGFGVLAGPAAALLWRRCWRRRSRSRSSRCGWRDVVRERLHCRRGGRVRLACGGADRGGLDARGGGLPADAGGPGRVQQRAVRVGGGGRRSRRRVLFGALQDGVALLAVLLRRRCDPADGGRDRIRRERYLQVARSFFVSTLPPFVVMAAITAILVQLWRSSPWWSLLLAPPLVAIGLYQRSLLETVRRQRELDTLKDEFIAVISHELRTPLASVYGAAVTLEERSVDVETRRRLLNVIRCESKRLATVVNDVLWASRLEARKSTAEPEWCDAAGLVREAAARASEIAPANVSIVADGDWWRAMSPRSAADGARQSDRQRRQVLAAGRHGRRRGSSSRTAASASWSRTRGSAFPRQSGSGSSTSSSASTRR